VVSLQWFAAKEDAARKYPICQGPNIHAHKKKSTGFPKGEGASCRGEKFVKVFK